MVKLQENSDKMLYMLEKKRAKLEERQMELDAQLRREEREFQLQIVQMLTQHTTPPSTTTSATLWDYTPHLILQVQSMTQMQPRKDCNII